MKFKSCCASNGALLDMRVTDGQLHYYLTL